MADGRKRSDLRPGLKVQIVLKQDQRSGKLTSGVVQEILTPSANHPHGIKVRLSDGQVGRVKQILLGLLLLGLGGLSATSASSAPRQYSDLRQVSFTQLKANQTITLDLKPGEQSLLFYAHAQSKTEKLTLLEITGPDDELLHSYDPEEETLEGEHLQESIDNTGELSVYLPISPQHALEPGKYTLKVKSGSGQALKDAGALLRTGSLKGKQAIDMTFWILSQNKALQTPLTYQKYVSDVRKQINQIIQPHGLQMGKINVKVGTHEMIQAYSRLQPSDEDKFDSDICQDLAKRTDGYRQLNVAILDQIMRTPKEIEDDAAESVGYALGMPGLLPLPNSRWSCVVIAYDAKDPHQGGTLWHESSHMMGVVHTTESDGEGFDPLSDTPECPAAKFDKDKDGLVDSEECAQIDASNYMFWEGDGKGMTAQQAWVLKRHPLFYPVP
jgi:uncharacterized repeat protein (TIGR03833 family)